MTLQNKRVASVLMSNKPFLPMFIIYDGLLDTLGASQILSYIKSIAAVQGVMVVLSLDKPNRFVQAQ